MIRHSADTPAGPVRVTAAGGQGRPLLLIHGWGGQGAQWTALLPALAERFQVLVADLPGGPDAPLSGAVSMERLGQGVATLLRQAKLREVVIVGHSMGGPVMVEAALAAPDRISGLLGLDTLADRMFYGGSSAAEIAMRRTAFAADLVRQTRAMIFAIAALGTPEPVKEAICASVLRARPEDLLALRDALFAWRCGERLPRLAVPLRLLNSAEVTAAHARDPLPSLARVPQTVYGTGHFPQIESPDRLLPALLAELDQFGID
ncbi:Pimeloyl-ACP methyl ester carboxylesterase [Alloyangia pacifica]|uniref:Pimeloyl-ACP methyl ester carboxylesterase n=1 Tax=Alloyangia pacifica TaxID=311180 RepID=A0A1I6UXU6_9RHOB|nr:Pimeloyl-ACP methyl ester carboxylesterase [Alloyangia pacifica]SFT06275.1 Pimeloyl-ACP methyl ester carboxylesterase [Alloyangia pacifica]